MPYRGQVAVLCALAITRPRLSRRAASRRTNSDGRGRHQGIDIDRLDAARADVTVIDVREPDEYLAGHVPGARLLPMGQLAARADELDPTRPVYVICASGNRSAAMTDLLVARGFEAYSVAGGTAAWARSGRPVASGVPGA